MAEENASQITPYPYIFEPLSSLSSVVGKKITGAIQIEDGAVFQFEDNTGICLAPCWPGNGEDPLVEPVTDLLDYFSYKDLVAHGLLTKEYILQKIGKEAGLSIESVGEGGDTFRINFS